MTVMQQLQIQRWGTPVALAQLHVMIFDDDHTSSTALRASLKTAGVMRITEASNRERCGHVPFPASLDVILSDVNLCAGSGLMLLQAIRMGRIPHVKSDTCFIFVTKSVKSAHIAAATHLDANGYLVKPFSLTRLRSAILRGFTKEISINPTKYAAANIGTGHNLQPPYN